MSGLVAFLAFGWAAHALSWVAALTRVGTRAAGRDEWLREAGLRVAMMALVALALVGPKREHILLGDRAHALAVGLFAAGQLIAIVARLQLGSFWGIGTRARVPGSMTRRGMYHLIRHPIYLGTTLALFAQAMLLQNAPTILLLAGAVVVISWKIRRENRWPRDVQDG